MQLLNVTNLPIYLPYDKAPVPFGDSIPGITCTSASPGVFTAADTYTPTNGDLVSLSYSSGGSLPGGFSMGPIGQYPSFVGNSAPNPVGLAAAAYYVVSSSGQTFSLSATKGGSAINTTSTGSNLILHLLSGEVDGVTLPFKPGNTVAVLNQTAGSLVLQGAPDSNQGAPGTNIYLPPSGPGTWVTLATLAAGASALVNLSYDWLRVSTSGTLVLQQN